MRKELCKILIHQPACLTHTGTCSILTYVFRQSWASKQKLLTNLQTLEAAISKEGKTDNKIIAFKNIDRLMYWYYKVVFGILYFPPVFNNKSTLLYSLVT